MQFRDENLMIGHQDPATNRLGTMEMTWKDKADSLLIMVVIVSCLIEVDGEEELAAREDGTEKWDGVLVVMLEDEELNAGLVETVLLEVVHIMMVVVGGIDELVGSFVVHLEAVDKAPVSVP